MDGLLKSLGLLFPHLRRLHEERNRYADLVATLSKEVARLNSHATESKIDSQDAFKILLIGYWGYRIVGDDAILSALLDDLTACLGDNINITVTSWRTEETAATYKVQAVGFDDLGKIIDQVASSDLVIVAGGGAYNEYDVWRGETSLTNSQDYNVFCSTIPYLCRLSDTPCMICGVGVEPLYSEQAKLQVAQAFNFATVATVRDSGSLEILHQCSEAIYFPKVTACPASRIRARQSDYVDCIRQKSRSRDKILIGVSLRHWNYDNFRDPNQVCAWEGWVAEDLNQIKSEFDCDFIFIPFQVSEEFGNLGNDIPIIKRVIARADISDVATIWDGSLQPEEIAYGLGACDLVIACRFHSVILSFASGVPCVALSYSNKVRSVMVDADLSEYVVDLEHGTRNSLFEPVKRMLNNLAVLSLKVRNYRDLLQQRGMINIDQIKQLLAERRIKTPSAIQASVQSYLVAASLRDKLNADIINTTTALRNRLSSSVGSLDGCRVVIETLDPLIEKIDDAPEIIYIFAYALHQLGYRLDLALSYYDKALARGAAEFWVRYNRGVLLNTLGQIDLAENDWRIALTLPCLLKEPKECILQTMPHLSNNL
jgi:polysaccharide pyruvyl transferase WcaK-like protein